MDEPLVLRIFAEVSLIDQMLRLRLERALPDGMRLAHFMVLAHIERFGESNPLELATALKVTKGAITNTVHRLSTRGLVASRADPRDGRAKLIAVTAAGRAARRGAAAALTASFADFAASMPGKEIELALPFLSALRVLLGQSDH